MSREEIIKKTIEALKVLPEDKAVEVSNFADFMLKKYEYLLLQEGIQQLQSQNTAFAFLNEEEEIYSPADLIEKFDAKR